MSYRHLSYGILTILLMVIYMTSAYAETPSMIVAPAHTFSTHTVFNGKLTLKTPLTEADNFHFLAAVSTTEEIPYEIDSVVFVLRKRLNDNTYINLTTPITISVKDNKGSTDGLPLSTASTDTSGEIEFTGLIHFKSHPSIGVEGCRLTYVPGVDSMPNTQNIFGEISIYEPISTLIDGRTPDPDDVDAGRLFDMTNKPTLSTIEVFSMASVAHQQDKDKPVLNDLSIAVNKSTGRVSSLYVTLFGYHTIFSEPAVCDLNGRTINIDMDVDKTGFKIDIETRYDDIPDGASINLYCRPFIITPQNFVDGLFEEESFRVSVVVSTYGDGIDDDDTNPIASYAAISKVTHSFGNAQPLVHGEGFVEKQGNAHCFFSIDRESLMHHYSAHTRTTNDDGDDDDGDDGDKDSSTFPPYYQFRVIGAEFHSGLSRVVAWNRKTDVITHISTNSLDVDHFTPQLSAFPRMHTPSIQGALNDEDNDIIFYATFRPGTQRGTDKEIARIQCQLLFVTPYEEAPTHVTSNIAFTPPVEHFDSRVVVVTHPTDAEHTNLLFRFNFYNLDRDYQEFKVSPLVFDFSIHFEPTKKQPTPFCIVNNKVTIPVELREDGKLFSWQNKDPQGNVLVKKGDDFTIRCPQITLVTPIEHLRTISPLMFVGVSSDGDGGYPITSSTTVFFLPDPSVPKPDEKKSSSRGTLIFLLVVCGVGLIGAATYFGYKKYKQRKLLQTKLMLSDDLESLDAVGNVLTLN